MHKVLGSILCTKGKKKLDQNSRQTCWHGILGLCYKASCNPLRKQWQEDGEFKDSLGYIYTHIYTHTVFQVGIAETLS